MEMTRIGTVQDPIPIYSLVSEVVHEGVLVLERRKGNEDQPSSVSGMLRLPMTPLRLHVRMNQLGSHFVSNLADLQFPERHVGCTGFPADSHDTIWMLVNDKIKNHRCPECGCGMFCSFLSFAMPPFETRPSGFKTKILIYSLQTQLPR
jgi:hypothetical protein